MATDAVTEFRQFILKEMNTARRAKDQATISTARAVIAALDNATAVDVSSSLHASSPRGVEVPRRQLNRADIKRVLRAEIAEMLEAAVEYRNHSETERSAELRRSAELIERWLLDLFGSSGHQVTQPPIWNRIETALARSLPFGHHLDDALGDLSEEFIFRARSESMLRVRIWYSKQLLCSIVPLAAVTARQRKSLAICGAAILAYVIASILEFYTTALASSMVDANSSIMSVLNLFIGLTVFGAAGYFATCIRTGSAGLLAVIVIIVVASLLVIAPESAPLWYAIAWLLFGPLIAIAGGAAREFQLARVTEPVIRSQHE